MLGQPSPCPLPHSSSRPGAESSPQMSFYQFDWDPHQAALEEFFTGGRSDRVHEEKEEAPLSPFSSLPDASLEPLDHHYVQSSFSVGGEADWAEGGQGSPDEAATVSSSPSLSGFLPPPALESSDSSPIEQLNYVEDQSQFKEKPIHPSHDAPPSADSFEQDKEEELFGSYDEESDAHSDDGDYVYPKVKTASSKKPVAQKAPRKPLPPVPGHPAIFNNEHPTHPYECPSCGQCYRFALPFFFPILVHSN